jgi:phospholipid/cholesterol/gamma-HCH transport system substrate-binding protein
MAFILVLGGDKAIFHRTFSVKIRADETGGLSAGSIVQISGISAGNVSNVHFDPDSNKVIINLKLDRSFISRITRNSTANLQTQGALGDKYVLIQPGPQGGEPVKDGDFIELDAGSDLISTLGRSGSRVEKAFDILDNVDKMAQGLYQRNFAANLAETVKNLKISTQELQELLGSVRGNDPKNNPVKKALVHIANILEKIDTGQGSLGGLINDPTVHEDLKVILGGAKRSTILKYIIRQAIKNDEEDKDKAEEK